MTSEVAFFCAGRPADALKAEKPGPVRSVDEVLAGLKSILLFSRLYTQTSFLAIHLPYYRHHCRVHKGLRVIKDEVPSM